MRLVWRPSENTDGLVGTLQSRRWSHPLEKTDRSDVEEVTIEEVRTKDQILHEIWSMLGSLERRRRGASSRPRIAQFRSLDQKKTTKQGRDGSC